MSPSTISRVLLLPAAIVFAAAQLNAQTLRANPDDWQNQQPVPQTQPSAGLSALDQLRQANDPSAAISLYADAIKTSPDPLAVRSVFIQRMIEFGMPALAEQQARDIVAQDSSNGLAWAVLADAAGRRGETANAIKYAANAAKAAPADEFVQQTSGKLLAWFDTQAPSSQITNDMSSAASSIRTAMTGRSIQQDAYNQATTFYREQERMAQQAQSQQQGSQQQGTQQQGAQQQPSYTEDPYGRSQQQSTAQQDQSYTEAPYAPQQQQQQQTYTEQPYATAQQPAQPEYNSYTYNTYESPDYTTYGYSTPYALGYAPYYGYSYPYYGYYGYSTPSYFYGGYEWPCYSTFIVAPYFWPRYSYYNHGFYGHGFYGRGYFGHGYFPRYFTNYGSRYYNYWRGYGGGFGHYGYADRYGGRYYGDRYGGGRYNGFGFTDSRYGYGGNRYQVDRTFPGNVNRATSPRATARDWSQSGIASSSSIPRGTFNRGTTFDRNGIASGSIPRSSFNRGTVDRSGVASGTVPRGSVTRGGNFNNYGYVSPSVPRSSVTRTPGSTMTPGRAPQSINRSMGTSPRMSASRGFTAPRSTGISRGMYSGSRGSRSIAAAPRMSRGSSPSFSRGGFSRGGGISRGAGISRGGGFSRGAGISRGGGGFARGGGGRGGGRR